MNFRINKINSFLKQPNIPTTSFNYLLGTKIELLSFKDYITEKLAEYRRTIFQTKKLQENEQA